MTMKIGILTLFYGNVNWGGVLQGYALKTAIEELALACGVLDCQVDIVDYSGGANPVYPSLKSQIKQYSMGEIMKRGINTILRKLIKKKSAPLSVRRHLFFEFMEQVRLDEKGYTDQNIGALSSEYDALISGSDQVWNPNAVRRGFLQMDIEDPCRRIAYAASIARNDLSQQEREMMLPAIARFHAVSVREKTAQKFLNTYLEPYGAQEVHEVLDPTLLLGQHHWDQLAKDHFADEPPYAVCFFFSDSLSYRRHIEEYCKKQGLQMKIIPHAAGKFLPNDEKGDGERLYDLGPCEFVGLMKHASVVFTDSFHGSVFSLIFQKPFCVFERDKAVATSKNSRLYDLLDNFSLRERLLLHISQETLCTMLDTPIDYARVQKELDARRQMSIAFLMEALGWEKQEPVLAQEHKSILSVRPAACTGCSACQVVCPQGAIRMEKNRDGFSMPILEEEKCVSCTLCQQICPVLHPVVQQPISTHLAASKNEDVRKKSSSGGLFYHLANHVISQGGVVWGAAFDDDFMVSHKRATTQGELLPLMTSKYVQSNMEDVYSRVLEDLREGKQVLFCGTPCQVSALANFARKKHARENLILVDFICHGVPSPSVWGSYLEYLKRQFGPISKVSFRDKKRGWHDYSMVIHFASGKILSQSHELNAYMRAFLRDLCLRSSCYQCVAKGEQYAADITLADAWKVEKDAPKLADDRGTSLLVVRTPVGRQMVEAIQDKVRVLSTDYEKWCRYNPSLVRATIRPGARNRFFARWEKRGVEMWAQEKRVPKKARLRYFAKRTLKVTGLEKLARKFM